MFAVSVWVLAPGTARAGQSVFDPADCNPGLDTVGLVVVAGGDFNGDGIADFAYSAPCARVGKFDRAGRVWIRNGRNGRVLRRARGKQVDLFFGASMAWVGDLNGDGRDELAVGTPFFDPPPDPSIPDVTLADVGQVRVLTARRRAPLLRLIGEAERAQFGASVAGIADINGDGSRDLVVAALNEKDPNDGNRRKGALHFFSGRDGTLIMSRFGMKTGQKPGQTLHNAGDMNGDGFDELLATSAKNPVGGVLNAGFVEVLASNDPLIALFSEGGARNDELGRSSDSRGDGGPIIVGSPGTRLGDEIPDAGLAIVFNPDGTRRFTVTSSLIQKNARFGEAVAALGDITGDGIEDWAAAAPLYDQFISAEEGFLADVGRVDVFSGAGPTALFTMIGDIASMRMGRVLTGGIDLNQDGTPDLLIGSPGDAPFGRRRAGSIKAVSGATGNVIRTFAGRRGFETRVFTLAPVGGGATLRSFDFRARPRELDLRVLTNAAIGDLSVAVLDENQSPPIPGTMRVALSTGHRGGDTRVEVRRAGRRSELLNSFEAFPGFDGGANVAAGDLNNDGLDELLVAQADSATGDVSVNVYRQLPGDPTQITGFVLDFTFAAFASGQSVGGVPINADGANLAVGGLTGSPGREIVAAPVAGAPVVRLFSQGGSPLSEFLAYDSVSFSGVSVAVGDLDGNGSNEIVTAPMNGPALIRAFTGTGAPFTPPNALEPVAFLAFPQSFQGGARVALSDIDFDGAAEILVAPGTGRGDEVRAFEPDGTPVEGFPQLRPFGGAVTQGIAITATDRFVRR